MISKKRMLAGVIGLIAASGLNAQEAFVLEEIIVTAEKREASVQDVAISMSAFSGDDMLNRGIEKAEDLANLVPGITVKSAISDSNPIITIRGIGLNDLPSNSVSPVSVYVDDMFLSSNIMMNFQVFDVERAEVLKGPQGTLYGRNTIGGAVKYISRKPADEFGGYASLSYGRWEALDVEAAIGGPLSDHVAARLAVDFKDRGEGYQTRIDEFGASNNHGKQERVAGRFSLAWEPSDSVDVLFSAHGGSEDSETRLYELAPKIDPVTFGTCAAVATGNLDLMQANCTDFFGFSDPDGDPYRVFSDFPHIIDSSGWGANVTIDVELARLTLTSITGYETFEREQEEDFAPNAINDPLGFGSTGKFGTIGAAFWSDDIDAFSQELRLTSDSSWPVNWIVGAYFSDEEHSSTQDIFVQNFFSTPDQQIIFQQDTTTYALFAHLEVPITEQWQLVGGLRYTHEEKDFDATYASGEFASFPPGVLRQSGPGLGIGPIPAVVLTPPVDSIDGDEIDGKIGLEWRPNKDLLVYANYGRGHKSGGFTANFFTPGAPASQFNPFDPEFINAYEIGVKSTLADGSLQVNGAIFYYDWEDFQSLTAVPAPPPIFVVQTLDNAGDAEIFGVEGDIAWAPTDRLLITAGAAYLDGEVVSGEFDGNELGATAEWTLNGMVRYTHPLADTGLDLIFQLDGMWQDETFSSITNEPLKADSVALLNSRLALAGQDDRWELALWGRNLSDEEYISYILPQGSTDLVSWGEPRSYGVRLNVHF